MDEQTYRSDPAISKSDLDFFANPGKKLSRAAADVGSALHCWALEGEEAYRSRYHVADEDFKLNTKVGKEYLASVQELHPEKTILKPSEGQAVEGMYGALQSNAEAQYILNSPGPNEVSLFGMFPKTDTVCKARLDTIRNPALADIKTTSCPSADIFMSAIPKYGYATQAAFYSDLYEVVMDTVPPPFKLLVVPKSPPPDEEWPVWVVDITDQELAFGRKHYQDLLRLYERYGRY